MIRGLVNLTIVKTYLIFQIATRFVLTLYGLQQGQIALTELPYAFGLGVVNDIISICYFVPIFSIFIIIVHKLFELRSKKIYITLSFAAYFLMILGLIFNLIAEIVFWDEFGNRFNFIAVDYLIYTNEIIGTLKESLPFYEILVSIITIALVVTFFCRSYILKQSASVLIKNHAIYTVSLFLLSLLAFNFYSSDMIRLSSNKYAQELSKNGPYEFFSAFRNNSLDYNKLYPKLEKLKALKIVRDKLLQGNQTFLNDDTIDRVIMEKQIKSTNKRYNIILITVESLSAEFMGKFGNSENITPYLDKIADEGIFFTNLYAAGTRTVRGLESITLSVPPTPGSSIIRRPNNNNLFNIGSVFKNKGYDVNFVFGGYSYFDNLENYFDGNGYNIIDRSSLKSNEISFSNIWGVADEDILFKSFESFDKSHNDKKPFFSLIMTTSNHRPYTFPDGRINLPSGAGRSAAVKYTDYAIGKFIEKAKDHEWFEDTIFIITADHCASSSGKTELPINKYHIPLIIYAPKLLKPQKIDNLASQIDIAPTIFGLLDFEYKSKFFGTDILHTPANRAFIGTYQLLGFMKKDYLVVLSPNKQPITYQLIGNDMHQVNNVTDIVEEAISFYQIAYDFYIDGKMRDF